MLYKKSKYWLCNCDMCQAGLTVPYRVYKGKVQFYDINNKNWGDSSIYLNVISFEDAISKEEKLVPLI